MPSAAAIVRLVHALYVAFLITAPLLLLASAMGGPALLRSRRFAAAHFAGVAFVVAQYVFAWTCPLTTLENRLAGRAADASFLPEAFATVDTLGARSLIGVAVAYLLVSAVAHGLVRYRRARGPHVLRSETP